MSSMTPVAAPEAPEPNQPSGPINHFGRLIGVFFSPRPTFEDIARRPSWILPVVLMSLLGIFVGLVMNQKVNWREVASKRIEDSPRAANMSAEQKEQQLAISEKISPAIAYCIGFLWPVIQALLVAGVMLLAFNLIGGANANFGASMGVVSHAYFPWILYSLLFILILYLKAPGTLDLENPIATNLGAFLPESTPKALMALGKSIDIFTIWTLLLISVGFTAINPKKLKGKSLSIVMAVWAIYVAIKMGGAWIFS